MAISKETKEAAKKTQFGAEKANPRNHEVDGGTKSWSIRNKLKYLAAQDIDPDNIQSELRRLQKMGKAKQSVAHIMAARIIEKAYAKVDGVLIEKLIDNIEGKLTQTNVNTIKLPTFGDISELTTEQKMKLLQQECHTEYPIDAE